MSELANNNGGGMRRVKFIPEVTLGNVLQWLPLGAAVVGLWMNMDKRISAVGTARKLQTERNATLIPVNSRSAKMHLDTN